MSCWRRRWGSEKRAFREVLHPEGSLQHHGHHEAREQSQCRSPRSANSCDVLHPVSLPGLALVWRIRLLPVARCRSDVGPDEACPNSLSLDRIIPIESAHAIVEASNHGRIQWFGWCPAVEPPDGPLLGLRVE